MTVLAGGATVAEVVAGPPGGAAASAPVVVADEYGHILPTPKKAATSIPPIIIRFFSRSYKTLFMKNKREFMHKAHCFSSYMIMYFFNVSLAHRYVF